MKIAVALSGGVDSATTLAFLRNAGHEVQAFTMKLWNSDYPESLKNSCFGYGKQEDIDACIDICDILNVPYTVIDLSKEFQEKVITPFKESYLEGITPNPCVTCNREIKFGLFMERIKEIFDYDYFSTGHYSNVKIIDGVPYLKRVENDKKDQTYFLWQIENSKLKDVYFPIAEFKEKERVREYARKCDLPVAIKKDSMSFADGAYPSLFENIETGNFLYNGKVIGQHKGKIFYTVGQRARISGMTEKLYIKNVSQSGQDIEVDTLDRIVTSEISFSKFTPKPLFYESNMLYIKLKQEGSLIPIDAIVTYEKEDDMEIIINTQVVLTPGQSCVIYNEDNYLVAGGII